MHLRLTSLKVVRLVFVSCLEVDKSISTVDVAGNIDAKPPKNLSGYWYVLKDPAQVSSKELPSSKL